MSEGRVFISEKGYLRCRTYCVTIPLVEVLIVCDSCPLEVLSLWSHRSYCNPPFGSCVTTPESRNDCSFGLRFFK